MTMDILPRADTIEERLNRAQRGLLSDEGLRAWYVKDVGELLSKLANAQREREGTRFQLKRLPLESSSDTSDMAKQAVQLFQDATAGLWQKAEVVRLREKTAAATDAKVHAEQRAVVAEQARQQAEVRVVEAERVVTFTVEREQEATAKAAAIQLAAFNARQLLTEAALLLPDSQ